MAIWCAYLGKRISIVRLSDFELETLSRWSRSTWLLALSTSRCLQPLYMCLEGYLFLQFRAGRLGLAWLGTAFFFLDAQHRSARHSLKLLFMSSHCCRRSGIEPSSDFYIGLPRLSAPNAVQDFYFQLENEIHNKSNHFCVLEMQFHVCLLVCVDINQSRFCLDFGAMRQGIRRCGMDGGNRFPQVGTHEFS